MDAAMLPKCLRKYAAVIESVSDERSGYDGDDGYWVYLTTGWWSPEDETHCIHENNPRECAAKLRYVARCTKVGCCA